MDAESEIRAEVHGRIGAWMSELFGPMASARDDGAGYRVRFGSASIDVSVEPWSEGEAVILARARVVSGADMTPELMKHLLHKNCEVRFGAFGVDARGDIEFRHSIVGSTCQKEELKASVQHVMLVADLCDDEIVARWGGRRALDEQV